MMPAASLRKPILTPSTRHSLKLGKHDILARALLIVVAGVLALFLLAPLVTILLRGMLDNDGHFVGLLHFREYLSTPDLKKSILNSCGVAFAVVFISVPMAFFFAYAINRSCMRFKSGFKFIALLPLLAPSLLSALAFIQWFGNQGVLKFLLGDATIYGAPGIILAEVYNTFPHAMMIITTALSLADARLYETADSMGTGTLRRFFTITLPSCKYGLISAATVVFTYVISDFGVPKVIGGNFNMLSMDVFKQVVGQHNLGRGAVVGILLLLPSILSFAVDTFVRRKLQAQLSVRSVPYQPRPKRSFDLWMTAYCALISILLLSVVGMAILSSFIKLWPYNLELSLRHYRYALLDGDLSAAYTNSLKLSFLTAFFGTIMVFTGACLMEKSRGLGKLRPLVHLMAMLSMAVPGLVLGLGYIMFFNAPGNPLNFLYASMSILVFSTIIHYYTSAHLTAVSALKALDNEFEAVAASLKIPFYKTFFRVTVPVCLPALLDIARYYFVVSMGTLSCVIFLYSPDTVLSAVAIMNLDEAGDIGPAAALASLTVATSTLMCLLYAWFTKALVNKTQVWRTCAMH